MEHNMTDNEQETFEDELDLDAEASLEPAEEEIDMNAPVTRKEARELMEFMQSQQGATQTMIQEAIKAAIGETSAAPVPRETLGDVDDVRSLGLANRQMDDLMETMMDEVLAQYPDCPKEVQRSVKSAIRNVETLDALKDLKKLGRHTSFVDAEIMKMVRAGTYTPQQYRAKQPSSAAAGTRGAGNPTQRQNQGNRADWMPTNPQDQPNRAEMELAIIRSLGYELDDNDKNYLKTGGQALLK